MQIMISLYIFNEACIIYPTRKNWSILTMFQSSSALSSAKVLFFFTLKFEMSFVKLEI